LVQLEFFVKIIESLLTGNMQGFLDIIFSNSTEYKEEIEIVRNMIKEIHGILFQKKKSFRLFNLRIKTKKKEEQKNEVNQ